MPDAPPPGPVATRAQYNQLLARITVTFDQALVAGSVGAANWSVIIDSSPVSVTSASASGTQVTLNLASSPTLKGVSTVGYALVFPPYVRSLATGVQAPAFSGLPIT